MTTETIQIRNIEQRASTKGPWLLVTSTIGRTFSVFIRDIWAPLQSAFAAQQPITVEITQRDNYAHITAITTPVTRSAYPYSPPPTLPAANKMPAPTEFVSGGQVPSQDPVQERIYRGSCFGNATQIVAARYGTGDPRMLHDDTVRKAIAVYIFDLAEELYTEGKRRGWTQ